MTFFESIRGIFGASKPFTNRESAEAPPIQESAEALRARLADRVRKRNQEVLEFITKRLETAEADLDEIETLTNTDPLVAELMNWCHINKRVLFFGRQYSHEDSGVPCNVVLCADGFRVAWNSAVSKEAGQSEHPIDQKSLEYLSPSDLSFAGLTVKKVIAELYDYAEKI